MVLKLVSYLSATTFELGKLTAPLYQAGVSGESSTTQPEAIPALGTGLDRLLAGVSGKT